MKKYILGGIAAVLIVIGCMWVAKGHNCKKENTAVAVSATDDNSQFVTLTDVDPMPGKVFGTASYHEDDYALYYNNIKENVATRVAAYQKKYGK